MGYQQLQLGLPTFGIPRPARLIARTPLSTAEETAKVVEAAAAAWAEWSETPAIDRAKILFKLRGNAHSVRRNRKTDQPRAWQDGRRSTRQVQRGIEVVEFATGHSEHADGNQPAEHRTQR